MAYTAEGLDYAWGRPDPALIVASGRSFVCRYLSHDTTGKNLTLSEARALSLAGLWIVLVYESTADRMLTGERAGRDDALTAARMAADLGMPADRPIYFACDFDAKASQQPLINAYLDGAAAAFGDLIGQNQSAAGRARVGMYGPYYPVKRAFDAGKIAWAWQTYAWSGGLWDPRAQLQQYSNDHLFDGVQLDYDRATVQDYGQWRTGDPMTLSKADLDAIAVAVLNKDGVIPAVPGSPNSDTNPYRALKSHVLDIGVTVQAVRKAVDATPTDPDNTSAIIAGVLAGLDGLAEKIIAGVLAGAAPVTIDTDALASKIAENLAHRLES